MMMLPTQPGQYYAAGHKTQSGAKFLVRFICGIIALAALINTIAIFTGRVDLISWFTGFTVYERDALTLFAGYAAASLLFMAIAFKWNEVLWWIAVVYTASAFIIGFGVIYGMNSEGPSISTTIAEKFSFENIKSMQGSKIPASGPTGEDDSTPAPQLEAVTGSVTQGVTQTVSQNTPARQKAADAHQKAVDIHTDRMKQKGYTWNAHLNKDEKDWCANKAARAAYRLKYNRATAAQRTEEKLKPEWLVEARCVTNLLWVK